MKKSLDIAKQAAAVLASEFIEKGMVVGIGTGSTVYFFIQALAELCKKGMDIKGIATSIDSSKKALSLGIPLINDGEIEKIDIVVDGADEIDAKGNMIKGGGGALLREKLVAKAAKKVIIIVDEKKVVPFLGKFPLAVEIVPFLYLLTLKKLNQLGYQGKLRLTKDNEPFVTDNSNYIYDIVMPYPILDLESENIKLKQIVGVVETGLFLNMNPKIIVGSEDGSAKEIV